MEYTDVGTVHGGDKITQPTVITSSMDGTTAPDSFPCIKGTIMEYTDFWYRPWYDHYTTNQ